VQRDPVFNLVELVRDGEDLLLLPQREDLHHVFARRELAGVEPPVVLLLDERALETLPLGARHQRLELRLHLVGEPRPAYRERGPARFGRG